MVERRPGVMPPLPGPPPRRRPPRSRIILRRVVALALVLGLVGGGAAVAYVATRGSSHPAPTTTAGPTIYQILFPEGYTREQMAAKVARDARIAHAPLMSARTYLRLTRRVTIGGTAFGRKPRKPEGFLFPSTYDFTVQTTSRQLIQHQLQAFRQNWAQLDLRYARSKNLTPYDVLTIASMVEKEALAPDERRLIASVIYNRLHARMPLGIDATLRYGLHIPGNRSIRASQLQSASPYNTRIHPGLPPTPIANPGLASLQAAAHPARTNYLYFVRKPDKVHHFFTASATAFNQYLCQHGYGCK
jgi:UPF0755 protein